MTLIYTGKNEEDVKIMKFLLIPVVVCFIVTLLVTPFVKEFALKIGAVDQPNGRKVHTKVMPRLGGLAIFASFIVGIMLFIPDKTQVWPIVAGGLIIVIIGLLDDIIRLSAGVKFIGQIIASCIPVFSGLTIDFITIPNGNMIHFGFFAIPITVIWIVSITNAINLIDGLDGLAAGVSSIAILTLTLLAISLNYSFTVILLGLILLGSTLGFLVFNFYPAKIFMGDIGSLFLGYMIGVISIMGFTKSAAIFSVIIPIMILAIPIVDTTSAIVRRIIHKTPITNPDKFHLHHCLLRLGFSHRQSVILIYLLSALFSLSAILFTRATIWGASILIGTLLLIVEIIIELTGIISADYRPILNFISGKRNPSSRFRR